jgi:hypothetical protein
MVPTTVTVSIPTSLLQRLQQVGTRFSVEDAFCRTEICDHYHCGFKLVVGTDRDKRTAEDTAEAMAELMKLVRNVPIPDFQI